MRFSNYLWQYLPLIFHPSSQLMYSKRGRLPVLRQKGGHSLSIEIKRRQANKSAR